MNKSLSIINALLKAWNISEACVKLSTNEKQKEAVVTLKIWVDN